jgi:hypothetical protein
MMANRIQDAISKGVSAGDIAYLSKTSDGKYSPFIFKTGLLPDDVEISDDVFLIRKETADAYVAAQKTAPATTETTDSGDQSTSGATTDPGLKVNPPDTATDPAPGLTQPELFPHIGWSGEFPSQKWMNFYTKVVSKFAAGQGVKLKVTFEASPEGGVSKQKLEETRAAIRELGLDGDVNV